MKIECLASSSAGNCYIVSDGETEIMLEIGIPRQQIFKRGKRPPRFCLLTHEHKDHAKGAKEFVERGGILLSSKGTLTALNLKGVALSPLKSIHLGSWEVMPFPVVHGLPETEELAEQVAEPFGYCLSSKGEKLVFATDTSAMFTMFHDVSHFLIECNWSSETISEDTDDKHLAWAMDSHFSLEELERLFDRYQKAGQASKIEEVYLCHLSSKNSNEKLFADRIKKKTGAIVHVCQKNGGIKTY